MPAKTDSRTGVCIVRATSRENGSLLIEVSTVRNVEDVVTEPPRRFTEREVDEALRVVSGFLAARLTEARRAATDPDLL